MDIEKAKAAVVEEVMPVCVSIAERHYVSARRELGLEVPVPQARYNDRPRMGR